MTAIRVTQLGLEVGRQPTSEARVTQIGAEVIQVETSEIRVSALALEVLRSGVTVGGGATAAPVVIVMSG